MPEIPFIHDQETLEALAPVTAAPIRHHVFVCSGKSCSAAGSAEVIAAFEHELLSRGMLFGKVKKGKNPKGSVVLTECSSVGFCAIGAAVMVYPDGIWYAQVQAGDVPRSEEHTSELQSRLHLVCRLLLEKILDIGRAVQQE